MPSRDWRGLLLGAWLGVFPDFDIFFIWTLGFGKGWHGSLTHSLLFALSSGAITYLLIRESRIKESAVYVSAVFSHAVLDFLTTRSADGVELLWPFWTYRFKLGLFDYLDVNLNAHILSDFMTGVLKVSLIELLLLSPVLFFIIFVKRP
jgi:membrane-bound metal-dependent hydrolase YbcI (DUF457 family)